MIFFSRLKLRWKLLVVVLPLVLLPLLLVGSVVSYRSVELARQAINQVSRDDLEHMASFTRHLLEAHHQQFQVYQQQRRDDFITELKTLLQFARDLIADEQQRVSRGETTLAAAQQRVRTLLKQISIGESGYLYSLTSDGVLQVHVSREQQNISNEQDGEGHYFIRQMCDTARTSAPGSLHQLRYPWRNEALGETELRDKLALYVYEPAWDWIIVAAGYIDESLADLRFEQLALEELKAKIKEKRVGQTGYIYCMDSSGTFRLHPQQEGQNFIDARDSDGNPFIRQMCDTKQGWIRYPWQAEGEKRPRFKIVRYDYFAPWDWIVAVGCYEDEFYQTANRISANTAKITLLVMLAACLGSLLLVSLASKILTNPIHHMIQVIRRVKAGHLGEQMHIGSQDELGELAATFNRMTEIIQKNKEMEASLAQHGKMASLGVLSSGVAHEINNPLGVILGYAGYLESKVAPDDPNYTYIHEIKRESKRCKKIVQDLLSYARTPKSVLAPTNLNNLLDQIVNFAANHTDMHHVRIRKQFAADLPPVPCDGDQIRQVAINLILNAGGAIVGSGELLVRTALADGGVLIEFRDSGCGMDEQTQEKIFEPFYTTKDKGTGLGLAISRQIIEQHQGRITLKSAPGRGTSVRVWLPLQPEE
ncbi:sensor histidine kinase [Desulfuromonas thiophila]|uniref:sensor histidine kinase n=1 Tax=Desulfuromonas thiophila TaxID=57664 RepID=UPI0024A8A61B|nr:cache domain-containing protein [Desulfuromonas thiophila]